MIECNSFFHRTKGLDSHKYMLAGFSIVLCSCLLLLSSARICVWTGTTCDCTIDCSPLCTAPSSCGRPNCYSLSASCCVCNAGYYPDGLVCKLCGSTCGWVSPTTECVCSCDSSCQQCSGPLSTQCIPTCPAACKTCDGSGTCLTCYPNATPSAPTCVCSPGYYGTPKYCQPCDASCKTCSSTSSNCDSCFPPATLSPTHSCQCPDKYSIDASYCQLCDATCATCTSAGPDKCLSCISSFKLYAAGPSTCTCVAGKYLQTTPLSCPSCHSSCNTCIGPNIYDCLSCKPGAGLTTTAPTSCKCVAPYDQKPDPAKCMDCHSSCNTCVGSGVNDCLTCLFRATVAKPPGPCVCDAGLYPSPDASNCVACSPQCITCTGPGELKCSGCKAFAILQGSQCGCQLGYYGSPNPSNCTQCPTFCENCQGSMAACILRPPVPSLAVLANNTLQLAFNSTLRTSLASADVNVQVLDSSEGNLTLNWTLSVHIPLLIFYLNLTFLDVMPGADANATVFFPHPESIKGSSGTPINGTPLSAHLFDIYKSPTSNTISMTSSAAQAASATSQATLSLSTVSSFMNGNPGSLWSMMNQLQLITYIPLTSINVPPMLASTLASLNMNSFSYNPFKYIQQPDSSSGCVNLPDFMQRYGVDSPLFLRNSGVMFTAAIACCFSFIPIYLLSRCNSGPLVKYFLNLLPSFRWGVFIRYWLQVYLDFGIYSLLQLTSIGGTNCFSYPAYAVNFVFAGCIAALFVVTPIALVVFTVLHRHKFVKQEDQAFNKTWGALFLEFRANSGFPVIIYYSIFMFRRLGYALTLLFLPGFPLIQGILMILLQMTVSVTQVFLHVGVFLPFAARLDQVGAIITELSNALVFFITCVFAFDVSGKPSDVLEYIAVTVIFIGILAGSIISVIRSFGIAKEVFAAFRKRMQLATLSGKPLTVSEIQPINKNVTQRSRTARVAPSTRHL